jgi:hypothetical protein
VDFTEPLEAFEHKKALETEVEILKSRVTSIALRTVVYALEERIQELDDFLASKGFLEDQAMAQKKLEKDSVFNELDTDGDGVISDAEMATGERMVRLENEDKKEDAQRNMAWYALSGMLLYPVCVVVSVVCGIDTAAKILGDMAGVYFIAVAGIVAAFFGAQAMATKSAPKK